MHRPRRIEALIVALRPTENGGAEMMAWRNGQWVPSPLAVGTMMAEGVLATPAELAAAGVPAADWHVAPPSSAS